MTDEQETEPTPPTERPASRTVPASAFVAAVIVAAGLGLLAVVALTIDGGGSGAGEGDDARIAAGRFAERFLSFEHDALDEWKADVLALSTGGFAGEVEEVEDGLRRLIDQSELDASTQVTEIFLGDVDSGTATVVLTYDREVSGASGTRSETDRYMQLELNLVDGDWLVDQVLDISSAGGLGTPAPSASTPSSTTAPDSAPTSSQPSG